MSDETPEPTPAVEPTPVEATSSDAPKSVKRGKRKSTKVPPASPTAAAQAILGLTVTGKVDHAFKAAVRGFQRSSGLAVNGRLDDPTRKAMGV